MDRLRSLRHAVASGTIVSRSASSASGRSSGSPCCDAATGSTTNGVISSRDTVSATAAMIAAEASMPVFAAPTPMSVATDSICSATAAGGSS
jgi:hypothetical protein